MDQVHKQEVTRLSKQTIGFRLRPDDQDELISRAERAGKSPHELAREMVENGLSGEQESHRLRHDVLRLQERFDRFEIRFLVAVEALLVATGVPEEKARAWVASTLENELEED